MSELTKEQRERCEFAWDIATSGIDYDDFEAGWGAGIKSQAERIRTADEYIEALEKKKRYPMLTKYSNLVATTHAAYLAERAKEDAR